ncbi:hypothetical protein VaNZ11_011117, partial [Volvox africanus]
MAAFEEEALIQRLDALAPNERTDWYPAAYVYLRAHDHWWCKHTRVMYGLATVLSYETQRVVIRIWDKILRQLSRCQDCVMAYHTAQAWLASASVENQVLLEVMARKDAERVANWLEAGERELKQQQQQLEEGHEMQQLEEGIEVLKKMELGIIEALSYPSLLFDADVMSRLTTVLLLGDCGPFVMDNLVRHHIHVPGLYLLAAYPNKAVQDLVLPTIEQFGTLASWEEAREVNLDTVLANWVPRIRQAIPPSVDVVTVKSEPAAALPTGPGSRRLFEAPLESLLNGMKMLLQSLQPTALTIAVTAFADLPVTLIAHLLMWRSAAASKDDCDGGAMASAPTVPAPSFQRVIECFLHLARALEGDYLLRATCAAAAAACGRLCCGSGEVDGVAALTAALRDAATSNADSSLLQSITDLCGQLLCTFARDERVPSRDLRRLLAFLMGDIHRTSFLPVGRVAESEMRYRTTAALEAFKGVALGCCYGGRSITFASDLYGQVAVQAVMALAGGQGRSAVAMTTLLEDAANLEAKMVEAAADVLCLVLQADATALAAVLDPTDASHRICPGVAEVLYNPNDKLRVGLPLAAPSAETAGAATVAVCELALKQLDNYCCTPAAYLAVAGCPHPAVALALILAAAHCAELEDPGPAADGSPVAAAVSSYQGENVHHISSFLAAAQWPVRPRAEGPNQCAVHVRQCPGLLLGQLRQA